MRAAFGALALILTAAVPAAAAPPVPEGAVRVASFNVALSRQGAGMLLADIRARVPQVLAVAEILLRVRPDIVTLFEFDRDPEGRALDAFRALLAEGLPGLPGLDLPHVHHAPVNTGVPSGLDLDGDGEDWGPDDAWGYGVWPGQYGMAVMSRFPVVTKDARSYRLFPWSALPGADRPMNPDGTPFHAEEVWQALRLSSKSHWILPLELPGETLHLLAAHPTPPVFDGAEDRNGRRNADEIRLLTAMIEDAPWLVDDKGLPGGLPQDAIFAVTGDLNADPADGEARREAIRALLSHPRIQDPEPGSEGAVEAAELDGGANAEHRGRHALDTADWRDRPEPGNLRVDYVLPMRGIEVAGAGVFWPQRDEPLGRLVAGGRDPASSDHRLVWVDMLLPDR